jgi:DNA invertase Pin-like site-specific DNA recombinase
MYNTHMKNIYLYIRYSTDAQSQGSSYERQLGLAREYCPTLIEDKEHVFYDSGKSAYKGEQLEAGGELRRFYDAVKSGIVPKGSTLLVEDLDRMSRAGMWKASDKLRELTENGIAVVTLRDRKRYEGVLKVSDALMSLIKQDLANEESVKKGGRVANSYVQRYAQARSGLKVKVLLPSWLEWTGPNSEYRVKEDEANTVRHIFKMAAEGHSYAVIAKDLNRRGVKPFRGKAEGKLWITASLLAIVKGHAVVGTYSPRDGGEPIEGYFPTIVDRAMFDAAQGARAERKRDKVTVSAARINVWGKVGVCGLCQRSMYCLPKGRGGQLYLVCSGKMGGDCHAKNIRADRSEVAFREVLLNAVNVDYFTADKRNDEMELRQMEGQIDTVRQRKGKLVDMLEKDPLPELVTAIKKANAEMRALEEAKAEVLQRVARDTSVERSRATLMKKIDLSGTAARMEANALLRRLAITTEIVRHEEQINYIVKQAGKQVLALYDKDGEVVAVSYSQETAERMHDRGEMSEPEHNVSTDFL